MRENGEMFCDSYHSSKHHSDTRDADLLAVLKDLGANIYIYLLLLNARDFAHTSGVHIQLMPQWCSSSFVNMHMIILNGSLLGSMCSDAHCSIYTPTERKDGFCLISSASIIFQFAFVLKHQTTVTFTSS